MKLFKISYIKPSMTITLDFRELEKIIGLKYFEERASAIKSKTVEAVEKAGGLVRSIRRSIYYAKIEALVPPQVYGYVVRELEELEEKIIKRYRPYRHLVVLYYTDKPFTPMIAVYKLLSSEGGYRILSRVCWKLLETGIYAERIGRRAVGVAFSAEVEPEKELLVKLREKDLVFEYYETISLDYSEKRWRDYVKRLFDRVLKKEYLSKGFRVSGRKVFAEPALYGKISVSRGVEFQSFVMEDGYIALTLSPRHELTATTTLAEEDLESYEGLKVKRLVDGKTGIIVKTRDEKASTPLKELDGKTLLEAYSSLGLSPSPDEPVLEVAIRGAVSLELPSGLKRIIDLREAVKEGLPKEVFRSLHVRPEEYRSYVEEFLKPVNPIEVAGELYHFIEHPLTL
ncbi:MAG: hypothetical protein DRJ52_10840 [Thermoprotei archaeon]|nr:MAG: hypothetical protein DRJ52_10840 [Thermoprotei archaeon]